MPTRPCSVGRVLRRVLSTLVEALIATTASASGVVLVWSQLQWGLYSWMLAVQAMSWVNLTVLWGAGSVALVLRRFVLAGLCVAVLSGWVVYCLAAYHRARGPVVSCTPPPDSPSQGSAESPQLRVASANVLWSNRTPDAAVHALAVIDADVLVTAETNRDFLARLRAGSSWLPLVYGTSANSASVVIWVRDPSGWRTGHLAIGEHSLPTLSRVAPDPRVTVVGVHLKSPVGPRATRLWARQLDALNAWLGDTPEPVVLAGDFNSSIRHRRFQPLLTRTFDAGSAMHGVAVWTWAPWTRGVPPMMDLDHVLVDRSLAVCGFARFDIPGSDHDGVMAHIVAMDTDTSPVQRRQPKYTPAFHGR